ncbi:MAG: radical SAM protein [Rhodocyclaceae bacterium]
MIFPSRRLSVGNHDRDGSGMTYVYPVLSRRARGVSVGINLNPNNACNWRCIYCQVPDLKRGGPPPIDLGLLETELRTLLDALFRGDHLERYAPPEARRVVDVAFSGNGEPTSAREFPATVALVSRVLDDFPSSLPLRLITNGSLLGRSSVREGIRMIGQRQGEVWFKIDGVGAETTQLINGAYLQPSVVLDRLKVCATLCPTWVQSCFFMLDDRPPSEDALERYLGLLANAREALTGVHLYGLARASRQPEASRLRALPAQWFEVLAERIRDATGLTVVVSP